MQTLLTEQEFVERALRAFEANPENRDIALARTLFMVSELHARMAGAFAMLEQGGIGGIGDIIKGVMLGGKGRK